MAAADERRKLVVYYSYTGAVRIMAESIAQATGADLAEIHLVSPYPRFAPWVYFWGGMQATLRRMVAIKPLAFNPEAYDLLWLGTPIWASNMTPPLRSWLAQQRLRDKQFACFASGGGGDPGRCFEEIRAALPGNSFLPDLMLTGVAQNKLDASRRVREWAVRVSGHHA